MRSFFTFLLSSVIFITVSSGNKLINICHVSNPEMYHTIGVPRCVLREHLDKGDLLGDCNLHFKKSCWNC